MEAWGEGLKTWQKKNLKLAKKGEDNRWRYTEAFEWWPMSGIGHNPQLAKLVRKALSIRILTGPAGCNWSVFGIVHTKRRNRMIPTRAGKLTKLYWNRRVRDDHKQTVTVDAVEQFLPDPTVVLQLHYLMEYVNYNAIEEAQQTQHVLDHTGETDAEEDNVEG